MLKKKVIFLGVFEAPACMWFSTFQLLCNSNNLDTTQDMYKFIDKMSNGNGLQGLPLLGTYWVYEPHVYNLGNHLVIQSRMSRTSTFWLACTKYRLVPYSPALVWFKNTRFNIHNATKFTTLGTFQGHFSFLRRNYPGKPFCTALLSFAPAYLGYDRYVHNHICVLACNDPLLNRCG